MRYAGLKLAGRTRELSVMVVRLRLGENTDARPLFISWQVQELVLQQVPSLALKQLPGPVRQQVQA